MRTIHKQMNTHARPTATSLAFCHTMTMPAYPHPMTSRFIWAYGQTKTQTKLATEKLLKRSLSFFSRPNANELYQFFFFHLADLSLHHFLNFYTEPCVELPNLNRINMFCRHKNCWDQDCFLNAIFKAGLVWCLIAEYSLQICSNSKELLAFQS